VNNLQITPVVLPNDNSCSDHVNVSNAMESYVILGGGDDSFNCVNCNNNTHVCGDYCSCKSFLFLTADLRYNNNTCTLCIKIVTSSSLWWTMESLQSIYDGNDIIKGDNIAAIGGGGNDTITTTSGAIIAGDYVRINNINGINVTITSVAMTIGNGWSNDILSCTNNLSTESIIIVGGNGDDKITISGSSNWISVCGDTCSINASYTQMGSVVNSLYDISYGIHGSDTITLTGSSPALIIGGGGQLDTIQGSGTYAICGDHCLGNIHHTLINIAMCFKLKLLSVCAKNSKWFIINVNRYTNNSNYN
jgi:hypothetical protein